MKKLPELGNISASFDYLLGLNPPKDSSILDIGTNFGSLPAMLQEHGYIYVHGIDCNSESIALGKQSYPELAEQLKEYPGDTLPYEDMSFDIICAFDVLEHIQKLDAFLLEIARVLKPGGRLVFQTPNIFTNIPWEMVNQRSLFAWRKYHCSLQSLWTLRRKLKAVDFENITIERHVLNTEYNQKRLKEKVGLVAPAIIAFLEIMPLWLSPNFWGHTSKKS